MDTALKIKSFAVTKANAEADLSLINQYSIKELTADDVFCFNVVLCDNDVDRDMERFTDEALGALATLFVGKTGIRDHLWSSNNQVARIYRAEVVEADEENSLGQKLKRLQGSAYMIRSPETKGTIDAIEGGILKEVSVGIGTATGAHCSLCGERLFFDWDTGRAGCKNNHIKGEVYDGKQCVGELIDPVEAYEFSFVAVPAQRRAGVTKSLKLAGIDVHEAIMKTPVEQLSDYPEANRAVIKHLQMALTSAEERQQRAEIRKYAEEHF